MVWDNNSCCCFFNKLYCQQYYDITNINNSTVRTVHPADRSSQWDRWSRRLSAVAPSNLTSLKHAGIRAIGVNIELFIELFTL